MNVNIYFKINKIEMDDSELSKFIYMHFLQENIFKNLLKLF